eukprot:6810958-Prymnesium_polylepis.3
MASRPALSTGMDPHAHTRPIHSHGCGSVRVNASPADCETRPMKQIFITSFNQFKNCLLYTSPSPRDAHES